MRALFSGVLATVLPDQGLENRQQIAAWRPDRVDLFGEFYRSADKYCSGAHKRREKNGDLPLQLFRLCLPAPPVHD